MVVKHSLLHGGRNAGFLDRDYRYKSVPTQIPHNFGLALVPYTGRKLLYRTSDVARVETTMP